MNILKHKILILTFLFYAIATGLNAGNDSGSTGSRNPAEENGHKILVIGKVSNNPRKHYRYLKPIADYAAQKMEDLGIEGSEVLMARDNDQMVEYLKSGRVDWVTDTIFSSLLYEQYDAADIFLKKWKKNASEYRMVFFTRKESDINSLSDLKGKKIAFEDPGSTTALYMPLLCLLNQGLSMQELDSVKQDPSPGKIGYVYSRQEINSSTWVHKRLVDAAAFSNQDWDKSDHMYKNIKKDMKIFYESEPIPRAFESVRRDLEPAIKARLKEILLQAHLDSKAKSALDAYQKTSKFTELDKAALDILAKMKKDLPLVIEAFE